MTDAQIADECGIDRRTLTRWKATPEFAVQVESIKGKAVIGATRATEEKAFNTTERLIELARLAPKDTNGTIGGQVKACLGVAQIRGEIVNRHEVKHTEFDGRTDAELEHFANHGCWPAQAGSIN